MDRAALDTRVHLVGHSVGGVVAMVFAQRFPRYQPATTIQAMARAIVGFTGGPGYDSQLGQVFRRTPVHLVAGVRSPPTTRNESFTAVLPRPAAGARSRAE